MSQVSVCLLPILHGGRAGEYGLGGGGGEIGVPALISVLKQYPPFMNMLKTFFLKFIRPAISFLMVEGLTTFLRVVKILKN